MAYSDALVGCKSPKRFRKAGAWPAGMQAHARPDSLKE